MRERRRASEGLRVRVRVSERVDQLGLRVVSESKERLERLSERETREGETTESEGEIRE